MAAGRPVDRGETWWRLTGDRVTASATVVQRALNELKHEGLVEGQPGKAVYVLREPEPAKPSAEYLELMRQVESLKETVDEVFSGLDKRVSELEKTAGELRRDRRGES